jgi:hypothetical protein
MIRVERKWLVDSIEPIAGLGYFDICVAEGPSKELRILVNVSKRLEYLGSRLNAAAS